MYCLILFSVSSFARVVCRYQTVFVLKTSQRASQMSIFCIKTCKILLSFENSPFRGARPKLTSDSNSPYPNPHSTHFLVPTGIFGRIYRTEQYFGPGRGCCSGRKPVRFGKSAQKYPWVPKNVWSGVSGTGNPNMKLVLV